MTRHNMGFMAMDRISQDYGITLSQKGFDACYGRGKVGTVPVTLAKPLTFMNLSGRAVAQLLDNAHLADPADLIVIHDDLDLPFGTLRIKAGGGHGGHRGLISIIDKVGSNEFTRIRLGIGRPPAGMTAEDYVLERFLPEETVVLEEVLTTASEAVEVIVSSGAQAAMNKYHGKTIN